MKKQRTPQEKKELSYKKDRRNCYGENHKSSVKSIRNRKRNANRIFRRNSKNVIQKDMTDSNEEQANKFKELRTKQKRWKKVPDKPLGEYLKDKGKLKKKK